jgi:heptosyltransferase III
MNLWWDMRSKTFDIVIDCRGSFVSYILKAKQKFIWRQKTYTGGHKVEQISRMVGKNFLAPTLWIKESRIAAVRKRFPQSADPYICVAPAANWQGKQWPLQYWHDVLSHLQNTHPELHVFVIAAPHERHIVKSLANSFKETLTIVADPELTLLDCAALIKYANCFVGNDSGLMHMSVAVQTPTIGLFGPSREWIYGPIGVDRCNNPHTTLRIDLSYEDLIKTPGFSLSHPTDNYMASLHPDQVLKELYLKIN